MTSPTSIRPWEYYLSLHQNTFALSIDVEKGKEHAVAISRALGKHLEEKGWLKLFFTWLVDESYRGEEQRAWVHEGHPGIRNMLTIHGMPDPKYPNVDIWCPQIVDGFGAFPEKMEWARKNKILWMYTSGNAESLLSLHEHRSSRRGNANHPVVLLEV